ncbi:MAG: FtsX-like permease family protein [Cyclobacteriaceae bacterium]|nr:ABC transporter permease [Cytophagales bacterium]HNP79018.1 ABC transporter permease [Cyclobacteriaceae bacterium]
MNLFLLVWNYLKAKSLNTALNIFLLSLGISVITVLLLFNNQVQEKIASNAKGIDLVVGAKGSPLQLILSSIFHIDFPTGNIKLAEAERLRKHRLVKKAIPMALGDSYLGFRIVGTNHDYPAGYSASLEAGSWWEKTLDVTIGATVAEQAKLKIGDAFVSAHGLTTDGHAHEENLYLVRGIMARNNSVLDNLILTNIKSIWKVHDQLSPADTASQGGVYTLVPGLMTPDSLREITSLLIQYRNPLAVIQLPRYINSNSKLQAAAPAYETARLFSILGVGVDVLRGFAGVLILISGLSIFIALYNSLKERRYDLAIMRAMGARRRLLLLAIIFEGSLLSVLGSVLGLMMGHGVLLIFMHTVEASQKAGLQAFVFYQEEAWMLVSSIFLGILCSLLPALQAYRTDIHKVLAGN